MFVPYMPNVPPQDVPIMIAQAGQGVVAGGSRQRTLGVCSPVPNDPANYSLENVFSPIHSAGMYLSEYEHKMIPYGTPATVTLLQAPKHGIVRQVTEADRGTLFESDSDPLDPKAGLYAYLPNGYLGKDKAVFLVEIAGVKVKVVYYLRGISGGLGNYGVKEYCGEEKHWKISSTLNSDGNATITGIVRQMAILEANGLSGLFSGVTVNFANLNNATLGQTTAQSITLDDNAAGHGWFIDYTPYLPVIATDNPMPALTIAR